MKSNPFSKYRPDQITEENINAFINDQLGNWAENSQDLLIQKIQAQKLELTGELLRSFSNQVTEASSQTVAKVQLAFNEYGRMSDMKNFIYTKMPPIAVMEDFVRKIGTDKFKYIPGYTSGKTIPSEAQAVKRLAWALSMGRLKFYRHKPKRWFARAFYGQISVLISNLISGYQEYAINNIKKNLQ